MAGVVGVGAVVAGWPWVGMEGQGLLRLAVPVWRVCVALVAHDLLLAGGVTCEAGKNFHPGR